MMSEDGHAGDYGADGDDTDGDGDDSSGGGGGGGDGSQRLLTTWMV